MEELLNKLLERGWKPFGFSGEKTRIKIDRNNELDISIFELNWIIIEQHSRISGSLRNLVSKESGLWQFVCENDLLNIKKEKKRITPEHLRVFNGEYQYRLIESALTDEDKLEDFILQNVKING